MSEERKQEIKERKLKIAARLKALRESRGFTPLQVAEMLEITPQAYYQYESGDRIPADEVKVAIAKLYNRSVATIFFA